MMSRGNQGLSSEMRHAIAPRGVCFCQQLIFWQLLLWFLLLQLQIGGITVKARLPLVRSAPFLVVGDERSNPMLVCCWATASGVAMDGVSIVRTLSFVHRRAPYAGVGHY